MGPRHPPERRGERGLLVVGSIAALLAFALLVGGCAAVAVDRTQRDDDGFLMSPTEEFSTATYAIVSESVDVDVDGPDRAAKDFLGTIRIRSESERPVFVGIARESDVAEYLGGAEHAVVTEIGREPRYAERREAHQRTRPQTSRSGPLRRPGQASRRLNGSLRTVAGTSSS